MKKEKKSKLDAKAKQQLKMFCDSLGPIIFQNLDDPEFRKDVEESLKLEETFSGIHECNVVNETGHELAIGMMEFALKLGELFSQVAGEPERETEFQNAVLSVMRDGFLQLWKEKFPDDPNQDPWPWPDSPFVTSKGGKA
jgi:hypothetical protein